MRIYPDHVFFNDYKNARETGQAKALPGRYFYNASAGNVAQPYAGPVPVFEVLKYGSRKKPPQYLLVLSLLFLAALSLALLAFALYEWRQTTQALRQTQGSSHSTIPARHGMEISTF